MKDIVLEELRKNKEKYLSGEELSKKIGVSRTSVWKYINKLKKEGYTIESSTKKGYILIETPDALYPSEINRLINTKFIGREIIFLESVDSTNIYGKNIGHGDFIEGTVIIAEEQTSGRGRFGREWKSPKGEGIWMTIMLKPDIKPEQASQTTIIAAYAVAKSIKEIYDINALIKWPNDIIINGKKVCGILTEMGAEMDAINYLIIGIGINANTDEKGLQSSGLDMATSLKVEKGSTVNRKVLVSNILTNFEKIYLDFIENTGIVNIINDYRKLSVTIGKEIKYINNNQEFFGFAKDINNLGQLIVETEKGEIIELNSGEVSVRGIYGYL